MINRWGVFNQTYAVAWQMGRALALADSHFAQELIIFRTQTIQQIDREIILDHRLMTNPTKKKLGGVSQPLSSQDAFVQLLKSGLLQNINTLKPVSDERKTIKTPGALTVTPKTKPPRLSSTDLLKRRELHLLDLSYRLELSDSILRWLTHLRQVRNLPFNYLVPQENLLPAESIRFFHIDQAWLNVLTQGALSIGIHTEEDETLNKKMLDSISGGLSQSDPVCGFLLRSIIVSNWPGLAVRAYADDKRSVFLKPLRQESLSSQVLLCLYTRVPQQIHFCQPQEQLSFGVSGDALSSGFIELRSLININPFVIGSPLGSDAKTNRISLSDYLRPGNNRVLNMNQLIADLPQKLQTAYQKNGISTPVNPLTAASLAIELVRAPERVTFKLTPTTRLKSFVRGSKPLTFRLVGSLRLEDKIGEKKEISVANFNDKKLDYQFNTKPEQLQVSQKSNLTLIIFNSTDNPVYVTEIDIQFPIDDKGAGKITSDPASLSSAVTCSDTDNWKILGLQGTTGQFQLVPKKDIATTVTLSSKATLKVTWNGVSIDKDIGGCDIILKEITVEGDTSTSAEQIITIKKYLSQFYIGNLHSAEGTAYPPGATVQLLWNVEGKDDPNIKITSITLDYYSQSIDVMGKTSYTAELDDRQDTVPFTLTASLYDATGIFYKTVPPQFTVNVNNPKIKDLVCKHNDIFLGDQTELIWNGYSIDHYTLTTTEGDEIQIPHDCVQKNMKWAIKPIRTTTYTLTGYTADEKHNTTAPAIQVRVFQYTQSNVIRTGNYPITSALWKSGSKLCIVNHEDSTVWIYNIGNLQASPTTITVTATQGESTEEAKLRYSIVTTDGLLFVTNERYTYKIELSTTQPASYFWCYCAYWGARKGCGSSGDDQIFLWNDSNSSLDVMDIYSTMGSWSSWRIYVQGKNLPQMKKVLSLGNNYYILFSTAPPLSTLCLLLTPPVEEWATLISQKDFSIVSNPVAMVLSPDKSRIYVVNAAPPVNSISVITIDNPNKPTNLTLSETITKGVGNNANNCALSEDGYRLAIVNQGDNTISIFDTSANLPNG